MGNDNKTTWKPIKSQILTRWAKDVDPNCPLPEYPRPQMKRDKWLNLNGLWDYAICPKDLKRVSQFDGKILVPFPVESALSGVMKGLKPSQKLWYHREFEIPKDWKEQNVLLHFGAVDWKTSIWINGDKIGEHEGGYTPFKFDISDNLNDGENEILLSVWDPTDKGKQERGKQSLNPKVIFYTAVSGIWQTVWLEPLPSTFVDSYYLRTDIDNEILIIEPIIKNPKSSDVVEVEVFENDKKIVSQLETINNKFRINLKSPQLWSPENPFLYDIILRIKRENIKVDEIRGYFGMRKVSFSKNENGMISIELNNKPIFQYGTLDQGYWPDGLYTAPTDDALKYDIQITKDLGFNLIRKHVKVESVRWYYHCDKLGILVWQDMPNGGDVNINNLPVNINEYKTKRSDLDKSNYYKELEEMIKNLYNFPSIIVWVPFNEGWGQFETDKVTTQIRKLDSTRLIDSASGWYDFSLGDIYDIHNYPNPVLPDLSKAKSRAIVVGEFGGLGLEVQDHMWNVTEKFVYRNFTDSSKLTKRYERLISKISSLRQDGLSAAIYTQITDVEGEVNGLLTYDREVIKIDQERLRTFNLSVSK
jgi:beta-galactosidase/beta-glucuronidase